VVDGSREAFGNTWEGIVVALLKKILKETTMANISSGSTVAKDT